jgi:DNA-binding response OmpR family regulator
MIEHAPRVLLVDDYPDALETWRLYLDLSGFDVVTASDGRAAVNVALETHPDIIVMDLELPVLSGFDATQELRQRAETSHTPVIAATGHSNFNSLEQGRLSMFDLVLVKPCDPSMLAMQIRRLLQSARPSSTQSHAGGQLDSHNGQSDARGRQARRASQGALAASDESGRA